MADRTPTTDIGGNRVDQALVSQASRRDANNGPRSPHFESFIEEHNDLVRQKKDVEARLAAYTKTRYMQEQAAVRRGGGNTLQTWIERRATLDRERKALTDKIREIEDRIVTIRPRVQMERQYQPAGKVVEQANYKTHMGETLAMILIELRKITAYIDANRQ